MNVVKFHDTPSSSCWDFQPNSPDTSIIKDRLTALYLCSQRVLTPFPGYSNKQISDQVCKEKYQEPLPDDCPKPLGELINACRAYDSFARPSAGGKL